MTSPRTPRQWNAGDPEPGDLPNVRDKHGQVWSWDKPYTPGASPWRLEGAEAMTWIGRRQWQELVDFHGPLSEVLPETPEPPQAPTDRDLLHQNVRFAIADPGHFLPRKVDEPVSHWSARAVMYVLGMLDMLGAPGEGYTVLASQSVPAVPVSSTGGKETGEAAETATEALERDVPEMRVGMVDGTWVVAMADSAGGWVAAGTWGDLTNDDVADWAEIGPAVDADELHEELYNRAVTAENELARLSLPGSETEWGIRVCGENDAQETGCEQWARAVVRGHEGYQVVQRRKAGPWIEVTS